jgi:hypothetical protein
MIRILTSAGSFAAAMALAAGPRISLKIMIQMTMNMHWKMNAKIALLKWVYFVTPQSCRCQE